MNIEESTIKSVITGNLYEYSITKFKEEPVGRMGFSPSNH